MPGNHLVGAFTSVCGRKLQEIPEFAPTTTILLQLYCWDQTTTIQLDPTINYTVNNNYTAPAILLTTTIQPQPTTILLALQQLYSSLAPSILQRPTTTILLGPTNNTARPTIQLAPTNITVRPTTNILPNNTVASNQQYWGETSPTILQRPTTIWGCLHNAWTTQHAFAICT